MLGRIASARPLRRAFRFIERENLHRLGAAVGIMCLGAAVVLWTIEPQHAFGDWLWWSIVTVTTVGYGDLTPASPFGRMIGIALMFLGIGTLGLATAALASVFVEIKLKKDRGMSRIEIRGHHILCGWGGRGETIYRLLRADPKTADTPIVVIDRHLEHTPVDDDDLHFVHGAVDDATLRRAAVTEAEVVVILGDDTLDADLRDARVVLETLEVESIAPHVYTVAVVSQEETARHCRRAHADEVIVSADFESRLVASSAVHPGVSRVISELLSADEGNDLTMIELPSSLVESTFAEASNHLLRHQRTTLLAVRRAGDVLTNPVPDLVMTADDQLIVIASRDRG
ncbi:MAG: ion channel [Acidobacteriota bacterium]